MTCRVPLSAALAWQPKGGLAQLLEAASRLLDKPAVTASDADRFLTALAPFLDLEAFAIHRGLARATPYHDFLYGVGKHARKRFVMAERARYAARPFQLALGNGKMGPGGDPLEVWVSRHHFTSSFRLDVSAEDKFTIPFRPVPAFSGLEDVGWLSFRGELPGSLSRQPKPHVITRA